MTIQGQGSGSQYCLMIISEHILTGSGLRDFWHPRQSSSEFRLNPSLFYLKFVKRDSSIQDGQVVVPLDHFEKIILDPDQRGPNGGIRVSFKSLNGRYMRQDTFNSLIGSGYIGAFAKNTAALQILVNETLANGNAVVAAIQRPAQ